MIKRLTFFLFSSVILLSCCPGLSSADRSSEYIRAAILQNADDAVIAIRGSYKIVDLETNKLLVDSRRLVKSRVKPYQNGLFVGKNFYSSKKLRVQVEKDVAVFFGEKKLPMNFTKDRYKRYRGLLDIIVDQDDKLLLVNKLPLERYIKGVLYHEVTDRWPMEAMKAQAVAARTYAVYQLESNQKQFFDVTSDIYSQVYGGRSAEKFRTNIAVDETRGEVLTYNGKIVPAYFHSNCGGHTEDVRELWNHDLEPLYGRICEFCSNAAHSHWKRNFQSSEVQKTLNERGMNVGLIKEIIIKDKNQSGRIRTLEIHTREGKTHTISGKKFREYLGPNQLKSNKYDIVMKGYYFDVIGQGWGHGVGMCQWGAYEMARKRNTYTEILQYYYPHALISQLK
ncbi:MAG: SpoIID/LytB domain-containing protein [Candidatus Omnitrophica bacterium]|nr:SpoIID/LytB domain-containing protein [Candidatus Omnitrophota bacterium]